MGDRFHKGARDGYLEVLKEATRKDLNTKDEDGMTPTLWAAFEGNLDALRLIVGRGGDPDKCDNYGNTALHFSAARGHLPCVSFLVNFGINLFALDIDFHSAKDLAAINSRDEILRFLDTSVAKEEAKDGKRARALKEKAVKEAEKRAREFEKLQKKAVKSQAKEVKELAKVRKEMEGHGGQGGPRPSMAFLSLRKDSRLLYAQSPKFSEIVANQNRGSGGGGTERGGGALKTALKGGGVYKKVQQRKTNSGQSQTISGGVREEDFKVGTDIDLADGKRSVRSLSGLRRDSEVMYVPKYEVEGKRGKIEGLFDYEGEEEEVRGRGTVGRRAGSISGIGLTRSISQPDYMQQVGGDPDETVPSIFERPGFGSVAFRNSITSTLSTFPNFGRGESTGAGTKTGGGSSRAWEDEASDDDELELGPVELFLAAAGLTKYIPTFIEEKIDLEALMLLSEEDLKSMGIEMGPRRKLLKAVEERRSALSEPGEVTDSKL